MREEEEKSFDVGVEREKRRRSSSFSAFSPHQALLASTTAKLSISDRCRSRSGREKRRIDPKGRERERGNSTDEQTIDAMASHRRTSRVFGFLRYVDLSVRPAPMPELRGLSLAVSEMKRTRERTAREREKKKKEEEETDFRVFS